MFRFVSLLYCTTFAALFVLLAADVANASDFKANHERSLLFFGGSSSSSCETSNLYCSSGYSDCPGNNNKCCKSLSDCPYAPQCESTSAFCSSGYKDCPYDSVTCCISTSNCPAVSPPPPPPDNHCETSNLYCSSGYKDCPYDSVTCCRNTAYCPAVSPPPPPPDNHCETSNLYCSSGYKDCPYDSVTCCRNTAYCPAVSPPPPPPDNHCETSNLYCSSGYKDCPGNTNECCRNTAYCKAPPSPPPPPPDHHCETSNFYCSSGYKDCPGNTNECCRNTAYCKAPPSPPPPPPDHHCETSNFYCSSGYKDCPGNTNECCRNTAYCKAPPMTTLPPSYTYSYTTEAWSSCSESCGTGTQTRLVLCTRSDGWTVDASMCSGMTAPEMAQLCNTQECYTTTETTTTPTTTTTAATTTTTTTGLSSTTAAPTTPTTTNAVNSPTNSYTYAFSEGSFGSCSESCGGGTRTRTITCLRSDGQAVADTMCSGTKPSTSQSCNTQACATPSTTAAPTTTSTTSAQAATTTPLVTKGGNIVKSVVTMVGVTKQAFDETKFKAGVAKTFAIESGQVTVLDITEIDSRRSLLQTASLKVDFQIETPNPANAAAIASKIEQDPDYSDELLESLKEKGVPVKSIAMIQAAIVDTDATKAPTTSYIYAFSAGSFGSCSESCGGGTRTRTVTCLRSDGQAVADTMCSGTKPSTSDSCNNQPCNISKTSSASKLAQVFYVIAFLALAVAID
ncbi:thrombospondin [Pycnococcus provasolii]